MKKTILLLLLLSLTSAVSFGQCMRATIIGNYNNVYLPTAVNSTDLGWTGNSSTCTAGTISDTALNRSLRRINYFRGLAGLNSNTTFDTSYSRMAQEAALMMTANNALNHTPPVGWLCYTADGATAAGSSNLALGSHSSSSINAFMNDAGSGNTACGHRRWILRKSSLSFGMGSTSNACALWVFGQTGTPPPVTFVAYPSEGFFPAPLVPSSNRWSFSISSADFSSTHISMTDESGSPVSLTLDPIANGYGDNTIVWEPVGINTSGPYDVKYSVQIDSVFTAGSYQSYSYDVIIAQPVHPPSCPAGKVWSENDCECITAPGITENALFNLTVSNPFRDVLTIKMISSSIREIQIYNYSGSLITTKNLSGSEGSVEWNTSGWADGIYFITCKDLNGNLRKLKVIKI